MTESMNIELDTGTKSILKFGFLLRACFILFFVIGAALLGVNFFKDSIVGAFVCFLISLVLFIIFFKILDAAFFKEQLIVTKEDITIIHKNLSNTKKYVFNLNNIKSFGFADQHYTKHPLDNPVIDFTGLAAQERELQYVIDEGNIRIETDTKNIKFGKNMPSWDVEELVEKIELFTGQKFAKPHREISVDDSSADIQVGADTKSEIGGELETDQVDIKKYTYSGENGELTIAQKNDIPSPDDKAFINGELAPTGKYQIGKKQFVLVSNGIIYAVRGFDDK